jgi:hypothetical protein
VDEVIAAVAGAIGRVGARAIPALARIGVKATLAGLKIVGKHIIWPGLTKIAWPLTRAGIAAAVKGLKLGPPALRLLGRFGWAAIKMMRKKATAEFRRWASVAEKAYTKWKAARKAAAENAKKEKAKSEKEFKKRLAIAKKKDKPVSFGGTRTVTHLAASDPVMSMLSERGLVGVPECSGATPESVDPVIAHLDEVFGLFGRRVVTVTGEPGMVQTHGNTLIQFAAVYGGGTRLFSPTPKKPGDGSYMSFSFKTAQGAEKFHNAVSVQKQVKKATLESVDEGSMSFRDTRKMHQAWSTRIQGDAADLKLMHTRLRHSLFANGQGEVLWVTAPGQTGNEITAVIHAKTADAAETYIRQRAKALRVTFTEAKDWAADARVKSIGKGTMPRKELRGKSFGAWLKARRLSCRRLAITAWSACTT